MIVRGSQVVDAPRDAVFAAICDPEVLLGVIPGCQALERTGEAEYRGRIALRLPGVVGTYATVVRLVEADAPHHGRLEGVVEGSLGTITGDATFRLADTGGDADAGTDAGGGGTRVDYDGRATIAGPLARLDSRFLEGLAGSLIGQGLRNLGSRLRDDPPPVPASAGRPTTETPS